MWIEGGLGLKSRDHPLSTCCVIYEKCSNSKGLNFSRNKTSYIFAYSNVRRVGL